MYGTAAITAARKLAAMAQPVDEKTVRAEWENAVAVAGGTNSSIEKSCPRGSFLGLYKNGNVVGVQVSGCAGYVPAADSNEKIAIDAWVLLQKSPSQMTQTTLWNSVCSGKTHNAQMDVVIELHNAGLLI